MLGMIIPVWGRWVMLAVLMAASAGFGYVKGDDHGTAKLTAYVGEQAKATVKLIQKRAEIVTKIQTVYVPKIQTIYKQGETIERTVTQYVTKTDDAGCVLPVGFVREFNAAWTGQPAEPAVESDRQPSGVPLSAAASADAHNATSCLAYKAQRDGWIEFYRGLQAAEKK